MKNGKRLLWKLQKASLLPLLADTFLGFGQNTFEICQIHKGFDDKQLRT